MYPYDDYRDTNKSDKNGSAAPDKSTGGYQWQAPSQEMEKRPAQTYWQGDYYRSYQNPSYSAPANSAWTPAGAAGSVKQPEKKPRKGARTFVKILAGVMACLMISAGSIGGFAALVNNGYVQLSGGGGSPAAFTINKVVADNTASSTASKTGVLTSQEIAKKVIPSVVCIQNYQVTSNPQVAWQQGGYFGNGDNGGEDASGVSPASEGSGIIATSDGYIITNAHVVADATSLKVILSDGKKYEAKLIGSDSVTDLALIKIEATGLPAAEFGSSDDLQVADTVMAIGNPGGLEFNSSVTIGYVSALNREITNSETGYTMECIQTDAAINPGNSGGALVNTYGQVVGINSSKIVATGYEGLGFAIPISVAQPIISDLKEYGYVKDRAILGISGQFIDSMTSRIYGLPTGMYVSAVNASAVSAAGIQKGDVITQIEDKTVSSGATITSVINNKKPGDTVTLKVTRPSTGKTFTATVKLSQATGK